MKVLTMYDQNILLRLQVQHVLMIEQCKIVVDFEPWVYFTPY